MRNFLNVLFTEFFTTLEILLVVGLWLLIGQFGWALVTFVFAIVIFFLQLHEHLRLRKTKNRTYLDAYRRWSKK